MLKIFISSTCNDLKEERKSISLTLREAGHEVVLSEEDDILYDPTKHTHESCINAVKDCDLIIFLIGMRYGGIAVPKALDAIGLEELVKSDIKQFKNKAKQKISITQCEVLTALNHNIPVYTFIKKDAFSDHKLYEKNKNYDFVNKMNFSDFKNNEEAIYIFEFFNFIRKRSNSNYIKPFNYSGEVSSIMKRQLSLLLSEYFKKLKSTPLQMIGETEILQGTIVKHMSGERTLIFDNLFRRVDGNDTIRILGTGVTGFLKNQERVQGYLSSGNKIEILLINNNIVKGSYNCVDNELLENINCDLFDKDITLDKKQIYCPLSNLNFLINTSHFNRYHSRKDYDKDINESMNLINGYKDDIAEYKWPGTISAKHFRSFIPMSISAISPNNSDRQDLVAEFIIPFNNNRIVFYSSNEENPSIYKLFTDFFLATWEKSFYI